ncbi:RDD family protein [Solirubrobacter taibaiensis]|nr:RDD family protein [Solirubrobacter taibaiensis]
MTDPGSAPPSYAGLATRTLAFAVDAAVINVVAWFVGVVFALALSLLSLPDELMSVLAAVAAVAALLWTFSYFVFFWSGNGQTPGNRLIGITVRDATSLSPLPARRAALRLVLLPLSALPLCAGFLLILFDGRRRALHDRLARTVVIYVSVERPRRAAAREAPEELARV